jgi:hypothetical protein
MLENQRFISFTKLYLSFQLGSVAWNAKRCLQPPVTALAPATNQPPDGR